MTTTATLPLRAIQLVQAIRESQIAVDQWNEQLKALKAELTAMHEAGEIPTKFDSQGIRAQLQQGRQTVVLDDVAKQLVKDVQNAALADGHAEIKQGNPFWAFRAIK